jgi:DNA-binding ferritin-like protein (Dps family)
MESKMGNMIEKFLKTIIGDKKEYREMMARVKKLPEDYQYVYKKMQHYMFSHAAGNGLDMMRLLYELIELFENGAAEGKKVLEITGEDVAGFCDELLRSARTYTEDWRAKLNRDILKKVGKEKEGE